MVGKNSLANIWDKAAKTQLKKEYNRIKKESQQGAETVKNGILESIDEIPEEPYRYPPDKFKKDNPGNYRAFEKYNFRIAYKITEENIQILRVRHVKREPLDY
jgi:plasmid stabilization system protein ParE